MKNKKPSDFARTFPFSSVLQKPEAEIVARDIMIILMVHYGDSWKTLSWKKYKEIRIKDGNFSEEEYKFFKEVSYYCSSAEKARTFCKDWNK